MKHAKPEYEPIQDPSGKIPEDEPVFLLRASDRTAPAIIQHWADTVELLGGDTSIVARARQQADAMVEYAEEHYEGGKVPD